MGNHPLTKLVWGAIYIVLIILSFAYSWPLVATILLIPIMLGLLAYLDGKTSQVLFFVGIGANNFVILGNLGNIPQMYFARIAGASFDPITGKRDEGKTKQKDFYDSWIFNYLANTWDIYYKGLNTKLIKPEWCNDPRIPFAQAYKYNTDECKVAGLPYTVISTLIVEQDDLSLYLYFGGKDPFEESGKPNYEGALREYFGYKGKDPGYDVRQILGLRTEGQMDGDFNDRVWTPTKALAKKLGRVLSEIAIEDILPGNEAARNAQQLVATATQQKMATITKAEGDAQAIELTSVAQAAADQRVGDVRVNVEQRLRKLGVDRMALAVENNKNLRTVIIGEQKGVGVMLPSDNEGNQTPPQP